MTDVSVLSGSEAIRFLQWLDPKGLHNLVAIDPVTKAVEAQTFDFGADFAKLEAEAWVRGRNTSANLYFSINEPRADARRDSKMRRDEIGAVRAFHVDIDNLDGAPDWDMDCMPSAVVDSGNGQWGFWKLEQPVPVEDVAAIEAQNRALTGRFHGDTQAHNLDRIARLPGTLNIPNEAKRKKGRVEVVSKVLAATGLTYAPAEVAAWCAPLAVSQSGVDHTQNGKAGQDTGAAKDTPENVRKAIRYLRLEAPEGREGENGDDTLYRVVAKVRDFGISLDLALDMVDTCWNVDKAFPPWEPQELDYKIRHIYGNAKSPAGIAAPSLAEVEFDAVELSGPAKPKKPLRAPMMLEYACDIERNLKAELPYLIRNWFDRNTLIVTYGESNSGKTHVALDQGMALACGRDWAGNKTHSGLVVYVAAEGGFGIQHRIMAHRRARPDIDWQNTPFALIRYPVNMLRTDKDVKEIVRLVKEAETKFGQKCVMVVIDTLSRALRGGDENSPTDMGDFVMRCDDIREATEATLHVIHHAGKNTNKGARGHSLLRAATDTEVEIADHTIICRKQRDQEGAPELRFDYKKVCLGTDAENVEVTSVVLDVWAQTEFEDEMLTPQTLKILDAVNRFVTAKTQKAQSEGGSETPENLPVFGKKDIEQMGFANTTVADAFDTLVASGAVVKCRRGKYKLK